MDRSARLREPKVALCGALIDAVRLESAVQQVLGWATEPRSTAEKARDDQHGLQRCRLVLTPNVHHAVLLVEQPQLREVYDQADLVLADGAPLVALARARRQPLPERVAGSDLVPALLAAAPLGMRVFLLGAGPGVAERAAAVIDKRWPGVRVVGWSSPPQGFEHDPQLDASLVDEVNATSPDLLVIGLGAPKQELWVHRHREQLDARVAVCAGATIDFLAGHQSRAPRWMQRAGLEWLHRVAVEPDRLMHRYAHDGRVFIRIAWGELRGRPLLPALLELRDGAKLSAHDAPPVTSPRGSATNKFP
jgi:N-acetylglucosaminyldiphosphoundecaprenol N-acetyl-beta-D-mannosaminyltransferase